MNGNMHTQNLIAFYFDYNKNKWGPAALKEIFQKINMSVI